MDMDWMRPIAVVALVLIVFGAVGALISIVTTNPLLLDSSWQMASLLSLLISLIVVLFAIAIGHPSRKWKRTSYW